MAGLAAFRPHAAAWYEERCTAIKLQCENQEEEVERTQAQEERHLEQEYRNENRILESARDTAAEERVEVREQKTVVKVVHKQVEEAKDVYERTKACPEEHRKLEQELEDMEAAPNHSEEDIDAECQKKKEILEKEQCVDEYVKAQSTLARGEKEYYEEREELSSDTKSAAAASQAVDPYEKRTDDAKDALDAERKEGAKVELARIDRRCQKNLKGLWRLSGEEVTEAYKRYNEQKEMLARAKEDHRESRSEVREQRTEVQVTKEEVASAKQVVETHEACGAQLKKVEEELASLEATPNESEEDIDDECLAKKKVLEQRKCVDKFIEAKSVLEHSMQEHTEEKTELKEERHEQKVAHSAVDQQASTVEHYKKIWEDAKAAQEALRKCTGPLDEVNDEEHETPPRGAASCHSIAVAVLLGVLSVAIGLA